MSTANPKSRRSTAAKRAAEREALVGRRAWYWIVPGFRVDVTIREAISCFGRTVCTVSPITGSGEIKVNLSNLALQ